MAESEMFMIGRMCHACSEKNRVMSERDDTFVLSCILDLQDKHLDRPKQQSVALSSMEHIDLARVSTRSIIVGRQVDAEADCTTF